jgi:hypothetical protein
MLAHNFDWFKWIHRFREQRLGRGSGYRFPLEQNPRWLPD